MPSYLKSILLFLLVFNTGCTSLFFYPEKGLRDNPVLQKFPHSDINFISSDGVKLHGWFFKTEKSSLGTILFIHGNAENISTHVNGVLWLVREGYDVFAFDYRGYGKSQGKTTIDGVHLDSMAALELLFSLPDANRDRVFVFGQSIGAAIAVYTVANFPQKERIKGVIIESGFSDYRRIAREKLSAFFLTWPFQYPLSFLFNNRYSPEKQINKISPVPILIIQGDKDRIVPPHHSEILYKEAGEPKQLWLAKGRGHIDAFAEKRVRDRLLKYLKNH